jgi:hypothetical protein
MNDFAMQKGAPSWHTNVRELPPTRLGYREGFKRRFAAAVRSGGTVHIGKVDVRLVSFPLSTFEIASPQPKPVRVKPRPRPSLACLRRNNRENNAQLVKPGAATFSPARSARRFAPTYAAATASPPGRV